MIVFKKTLNNQEIIYSKKAGIGAYNGISEESLWIYEFYKIKAYWANFFVSIIITLFIGILNIRYYGGYNFVLGAVVGISFDNFLSNDLFNVSPISFNLGFLITTSIGIMLCSLTYRLFFIRKTKFNNSNNTEL
ncbi:hypothetical protein [Spiroplasma endosymbiont of Labia minor]|uniref:hypothetical protein n=1 Tax=Spiroplasma endosymbiont of Labia minor TaxID=3066305 RepID=UPI0030D100F2